MAHCVSHQPGYGVVRAVQHGHGHVQAVFMGPPAAQLEEGGGCLTVMSSIQL